MPRSLRATSEVVRLANARMGEGFIAVSADARRKFWLDRAKTAAIAKHTNAFKINEDVVIPLERLGEYTDAIERINIELSIRNKLELLDALEQAFFGRRRRRTGSRTAPRPSSSWEQRARGRRDCSTPWMSRRRRCSDAGGPRHPATAEWSGTQALSGSLFERLQERSCA